MKTIVIYHGGCRDGFCAAWVYNKYATRQYNESRGMSIDPREVEYFPGFYGQSVPDVKDKNVIILDFAYSPEMMLEILKDCARLTWLDHHKTAKPVADALGDCIEDVKSNTLQFNFDLASSGAGIAWYTFFKHETAPWLVRYVEDRDLWLKKLPKSDLINAYIACLEFDFDVWEIASRLSLGMAEERGFTAELKTQQYVREVCKNVYFADIANPPEPELIRDIYVAYKNIPIVNICQIDCSEVLHELCKLYPDSPFSLYWFKRQDGLYQYGLRSIGEFDVSAVAKLFGGGGHKNAAGFQLKYLLEELQ